MIKAGIYGGSGYMGGEVLRVLYEHPGVEIAWVTSRGDKPVEYYHRNFYGWGLPFIKPEEVTPCDVIFFAVPTGQVMKLASDLLKTGTRLIDLGADFRLKNKTDWEFKYKMRHACWDLVEEAVYGITELHREEIKKARIVANPGCYATASILGMAPLVKKGLVDMTKIVIDGLSGTTGAGAEPELPSHHPEIANNIVPYNVVDHRHTYEIEQELGLLAGSRVVAHLTTSYIPITRGILAVCHCFPEKPITRKDIVELYQDFYKQEPFIKIFNLPKEEKASWQYLPYPWVAAVSGTNYCHIGFEVDDKRNRIVVFSVLDSIGKGGAYAGVQNMNLMFSQPEETGLTRIGLHPY